MVHEERNELVEDLEMVSIEDLTGNKVISVLEDEWDKVAKPHSSVDVLEQGSGRR
jgi:hypothetical protein